MNINPNAIRVLCYGDSNTWGRDPHGSEIRYPLNIRWTGLLQKNLGDDYEIIEEGLGGRTTILDQTSRVGKNGKTYLKPCLETHNPIDVLVLMLGTNDLKEVFNQSVQNIADNIDALIVDVKEFAWNKAHQTPQIILVAPPIVDESVVGTQEKYKGAEEKSIQFGKYYKQIAEKNQCFFIDIGKYVKSSKIDGYHLDPDAHTIISDIFTKKILDITKV